MKEATARTLWRQAARCPLARCVVAGLCAGLIAGCATPPEAPAPPVAVAPMPAAAPAAPAACPACADRTQELAELRRELAGREAELRELRATQREQVRVIQQTTREASRAKVRLRRLATQAEAAAYIAEVEVALDALRSARGVPPPMLALADAMLAATAASFAQGDYAATMDRTAQAEQVVAVAGEFDARRGPRAAARGELLLQTPLSLRAAGSAQLRREPRRTSPASAALDDGAAVVARAVNGRWFRVETESGKSGWLDAAQLAVP